MAVTFGCHDLCQHPILSGQYFKLKHNNKIKKKLKKMNNNIKIYRFKFP